MLRLVVCGVIIVGCGYLGLLLSDSYKRRVTQLEDWQNILSALEFNIGFMNLTLREALMRCGDGANGSIRDVMTYICERLSEDRCCDMQSLWKRALDRFGQELCLTQEDKKILIDFSKALGSGDCANEINNIKMALARLSVAENDAREIAKRNVKMYRGLGFLAGIFIVIVLI